MWRTHGEKIETDAKKVFADLIIMGTHGRTGLDHVLFGSTAEKVARKSPCPVLTVRLPGKRFKMPSETLTTRKNIIIQQETYKSSQY